MNVVTVERQMTASLRGRPFMVTAEWRPSDPCAIRLVGPHGRLKWWLSREVVAMALAGQRIDPDAYQAARIEIVRTADEDGGDMVEVTRYFVSRPPVSVWFAAGDWQQLLEDTLCVVPLGEEHLYMDWDVGHAALLKRTEEAS